jgi:hydroxypyruvate reductase/glycerate 2-kinase
MSLKNEAKEIALSAMQAVMPQNLISSTVFLKNNTLQISNQKYDLNNYSNIYVYGSGKASIEMVKSIQNILKTLVKEYFVVSNYFEEVNGVEVFQSSHPLPTKKSLEAGELLFNKFSNMKKDDLYIYLLSGGTSAMIEKPIDGLSIEEFSKKTDDLIKESLSIQDINRVRKSLSLIKDGGLAKATKAQGVVLVISDVIGDDLNSIGSAPLYCENGPKHFVIGSNKIALSFASKRAKEFGFESKIISSSIDGDVKEVAKFFYDSIKQEDRLEKPICLLFGGESTVKVTGDGKGGRNSELCLWVLKYIKDLKDITFASIGTDGIDGNSDSAGGVVQSNDIKDDIDIYLKDNNSYEYLKRDNNLIITGDSGTNVMDIMVAIKGAKDV